MCFITYYFCRHENFQFKAELIHLHSFYASIIADIKDYIFYQLFFMNFFPKLFCLGKKVITFWLLLLLCLITVKGQARMVISKLNGQIDFDGYVTEPAWDIIQPLPMVMHSPVFGKEPSERSEVRIGYTHEFIFISARFYDREPSKIMTTSRKRDELSGGNDWFIIIFDSFNDKENGLGFATTPAGLRLDFAVLKDGISQLPEMPFNVSWNTFWDVKVTRDNQGWYAEMRIPLSSLRFKEDNGQVIMGMTCVRMIAHLNETDIFPAIPPNWGFFSIMRVSLAREVVFEGIHSKKPFYIAPYLLGGYQVENRLNDDETAYHTDRSPKLTAGLDLKYGLTNNLTMDVTLNTDFAQVEADDEQINLTRFSLLFPEKRSFFQERSSIFNFDFEQGNSLFYSRRIGLSEGEPVPLYGGVRISGMAGKWDLGLMDMQTREHISLEDSANSLPSENFGNLRMRRNILNENSYLGGIISSRIGTNGQYNVAYGVDAIIKLFGNDYFNIKLAQVVDKTTPNTMASLEPTGILLNWKRFTNKGLGYNFTYGRFGKYFEPGTGFMMRNDYAYYDGMLSYGWIRGEKSRILNDNIEAEVKIFQSNENGMTESLEALAGYIVFLKSGMFSYTGLSHNYENVTDSFSFSDDAHVPPGKYNFNLLECHMQTSETKLFNVGMDLWAGTFYDGNRFSIGLTPSWNLSSSLQLKAEYEFNRLRFPGRDQRFDGHVARIRALVMLSTSLSFSTFIQFNNTDHNVVTNLRLRYNPREGNDFFIVYNEGRNTDLDREVPRLPSMNNRVILLKYTYTFNVRK